MTLPWQQIGIALIYLIANVVILRAILAANRPSSPKNKKRKPSRALASRGAEKLSASEILQWEFKYVRTTASEAMQDRHTMINFYLLATGVVASGVVAVVTSKMDVPIQIGTV